MNTKAKRKALKADLLAGRGVENKSLKEKKKGKAFIEMLDKCKTLSELVDFLSDSMPLETLKDRMKHLSDNELVIALQSAGLRVNINRGYEPRHVEKVILVAARCSELPNKKTIKAFKFEVNKRIAMQETANNDNLSGEELKEYQKNLG